ncbi:MAG TPA: ATP-binding protein [Kofleriaceae bacterium]
MSPQFDLSTFLREHRKAIVDDFTHRAARLAPHAMSKSALTNNVPKFIDDVAEVLRRRVTGSAADALVAPVAREHGRQRVRYGYPIELIVREYGVLCDCIFERLAGAELSPSLGDLQIFVHCVDAAIADAALELTKQYSRVTNHEQLHLAALFDQAPGFVAFLRGPELRFELANAAYYQAVGHRDLIGRTAREALPELADQGFFETLERVYQTGEPYIGRAVPIQLQRGPGAPLTPATLDFIYQPIRAGDGETLGIFVQGHDVTTERMETTRRAETEAALRLSETRYRTLFESIDDGFCLIRMIFDAAGTPIDYTFLEANQAFVRHTGLGAPIGKSIRQLVPAHDVWWCELYGRVAHTGVAERFESQAVALGQWFEVYAQRVGDPQLHEVAVVFKDITDRKLAEAEHARLLQGEQAARKDAETASQLRDQFLATVSHELRTPLSAILGWAQMLRGQQLPPEKQERALETIERNARAQAQLIEDLLDVSRILAGQLRIESQPIDLKSAVDAAIETVMPAALARDIRMTASAPAGISVVGDAARLQQVVWNLLSNAVKFTPKGGTVTLHVRQDDGTAEITVTDTGKGIPADFQPHVFDRFRQADGAISRSYGGLGLGLSIVKELVHLHGGTVTVASAGDGQGSTFTVRIPAVVRTRPISEQREALVPRPAGLTCPPQLKGTRIVVVEDDDDTRDMLASLLGRCGVLVRTAPSAATGLAAIIAEPPDVLVTDIGMPGDDGYALIERVRALPPAQGGLVPAVALTAYARREDRARALNAGFDNHVAKPVDPDELLAVLVTMARRHRRA